MLKYTMIKCCWTLLHPYLGIHMLCTLTPFCIPSFCVNQCKLVLIWSLYALTCAVNNELTLQKFTRVNVAFKLCEAIFSQIHIKPCLWQYFWQCFFKQPNHSLVIVFTLVTNQRENVTWPRRQPLLLCAACDHLLFNLGNTFVGSSQDFIELGEATPVFAMVFGEQMQSLRWISWKDHLAVVICCPFRCLSNSVKTLPI